MTLGPGEAAARQAASRRSTLSSERHPAARRTDRARVLVVEDDEDIAQLIKLHLEDLPGKVTTVSDGEAGLSKALTGAYDLVVLDVRLPGRSGLDVCQTLRAQGVLSPILVVSAKSADVDRIVGLELGADDYLPKPFNVAELVARARALLRRNAYAQRAAPGPAVLRVSDVVIDPAQRKVSIGAKDIDLTSTEFDLLFLLARNRGRVFTRAQILEAVWKSPCEQYEHNVNCHINRLRLKLEANPRSPRYILTVWSVGYKFAA